MQSETKYTKQDLETMRAWSLQRKIQVTQTRIIEWIGRYDWNVYISFSGGKDSTVLADLTARAYQAFRLTYADGTVEIVEIKSKFVRRMQRDYPVRRRVFLEQIARPAGWKFTEIITAEDKDDLKRWRELAKEG